MRWGQGAVLAVAAARELDDAIPRYSANEFDTARSCSSRRAIRARAGLRQFLAGERQHWLAREIALKWKRVLKRVDLTSRSLVTLVEPGSCFAGTLAELVFAADRSYMLIGKMEGDNRPPGHHRAR
jgi:benzoyl-CoA-dihydrodiol lyase